MTRRRDNLLDSLLVLAALGLHLVACDRLEILPPNRVFEGLLVGLPLAAGLVALLAVLIRGERRPLQVACLLQWLMVLYTLPADFLGLFFVPSAAVLSIAVFRRHVEVSTAPQARS